MASHTRFRALRPRSAVVFVEDEGLAAIVEELLLEEGWEIWATSTLDDAQSAIGVLAPGVVIVDPGLHVEALEPFLASFEGRTPPAVVILSDLRGAEELAREHHVHFVREPFDLEEFVATVESARAYRPATHRSRAR